MPNRNSVCVTVVLSVLNVLSVSSVLNVLSVLTFDGTCSIATQLLLTRNLVPIQP